MANPITAYMDWRDNQMWKASKEPFTRGMLHAVGIGTLEGLIGVLVGTVFIAGIGGIATLVEKVKG